MTSDENAEIFSWCPFAGRSNDPRYAECYEPDEENKPRVFTVGELCKHVFDSHQGRYLSFCKYIEHHIKECLCEKDGRRIVVSSTPLDSTYILSEMRKFVDEKSTALAQAGEFIIYANRDGKSIVDAMKLDYKTKVMEDAEDITIDRIQSLLADIPAWVGTIDELRSKINYTTNGEDSPLITCFRLGKVMSRIKKRLLNHGIRFFNTGRGPKKKIVYLQRKVNGTFASIGIGGKVIIVPHTPVTKLDDAKPDSNIQEVMREMTTVKIQKAANGRVLGACVVIPAEIMERYVNHEYVEFEITDVIGGIMLKAVG